ncbi:ABC transporter permease [Mucilaginibacter conchicola]|uniref:ABC transporter permease n=1 Tax=Mucilaginibacter conchicola TaxID=2303333 RepID=A0A372NNE7_9SPHI|nr:ABC transporter permease [Mucilaginibacter conchicola]RFZ89905.1 ABC transporter permease [Mucilaginibacter conchicola]
MWLNYFKIAWRKLYKDGFYSVINILGLSIATSVFLLIINFVNFEYSYEDFHLKADNIYRITYELYQGAKYVTTDCETHPPLGPMLKDYFPDVREFVRMQHMEAQSEISYHDQVYRINYMYAADPSVFDVFNFDLIEGNIKEALNAPMRIVVSESQSRRIFGTVAALGKHIKIGKDFFEVSGVMKDIPSNTHLKADVLLSFSTLPALGWDLNSWNGNNNYTYLLMRSGTDLTAFNQKLKKFSMEMLNGKISKGNLFTAEPIKSIHLYSHKTYEPDVNGDAKSVKFMFLMAILILAVGSVNYVNLTTARATRRLKETGMRRLLGSSRPLLILQFMLETVLTNIFAMAVALWLIKLALPFYLALTGLPSAGQLFSGVPFWTLCAVLLLLNCILSGLYPAISLSATKPIRVVNRVFTASRQGDLLRRSLVLGQFIIALVVLSASFIVYQQLAYMKNQNKGINPSQVLVLNAPMGQDQARQMQDQALKNQLAQIPGVSMVTTSGALPGVSQHDLSSSNGISRYGSRDGLGYNFYSYGIDADFIPAMEIRMAAGENFHAGDSSRNQVIINEAAAKLFGFNNAAAAIGQKLDWNGPVTIRGVVKDYHQLSMKEAIIPMLHFYSGSPAFYSLRFRNTDPSVIISKVRKVWKNNYQGYPLDYRFLDDMFDQQYKNEQRFGQIVNTFSLITLFITCLGILGLTAYNISVRTKEIGIRKVLGASVTGIVKLLSLEFVKLITIALLIATPLAWYAMDQWLSDFAYRIKIHWSVFAGTGLTALLMAMATVSFQSVKAALMKPAQALNTD